MKFKRPLTFSLSFPLSYFFFFGCIHVYTHNMTWTWGYQPAASHLEEREEKFHFFTVDLELSPFCNFLSDYLSLSSCLFFRRLPVGYTKWCWELRALCMEKAGESFYSPRLSLRSFLFITFFLLRPSSPSPVFSGPKQIVGFFSPSLKGLWEKFYITGGHLSLSLSRSHFSYYIYVT